MSTSHLRFLAGHGDAWSRWKQKTDTKEVLHDFLRLAHADTTDQNVLKFSERWGPLWRCRQQLCAGEFPPCSAYMGHTDYCFWNPYEPTREYVIEAQRAKSLLDVRDKHKPVSQDLWKPIYHIDMSDQRATQESDWNAEWDAKYGLSTPVHDPDATCIKQYPAYGVEQGWRDVVKIANQYVATLGRPDTSLTYADTASHPI